MYGFAQLDGFVQLGILQAIATIDDGLRGLQLVTKSKTIMRQFHFLLPIPLNSALD
jgi:hypothetical protein